VAPWHISDSSLSYYTDLCYHIITAALVYTRHYFF